VNAQLLLTSYAWVHADGSPGTWGRVDEGQYGLSAFYRLYECGDQRWLFLAAARPEHRHALATLVQEDWSALDDTEKVAAVLESRFREHSAAHWVEALDHAGVPAEVVNEDFCRSLFDDPQARARGLVSETRAGNVGRFEDPGLLVDFSMTPGVVQRGPCMCGEHTRELMLEYGYTPAEVDALVANGVVLDAPVEAAAR
jgi:crotonobetainyl-CoA:carnitine CoA-transferase CaiB-like acyl-CoA transferase